MAIIRQKTQAFNQSIGVVRSSSSGEQIGRAISSAANSLTDTVYRRAAEDAQERGQKEALAQSSRDIATIDPETGQPVAYKAPTSYGRIATKSYQGLIDRRFADSLMGELQDKGAELAASSSSAAQYRDRMSNYIGEMYKSAVSENGELNAYGRQIKDAGGEYVASTYSTLRKKEVEAQRAAVLRANKIASYSARSQASKLIAIGDTETASALIAAESQRNEQLFDMPNGISFSEYKKSREELDGLSGLMSSTNLVSQYSNLGPAERKLIERAIANPAAIAGLDEALGIEGVALDVAVARANESTSSLLSGLRAAGQIESDITESAADAALEGLGIDADVSLASVTADVNAIADPQVREQVREEANLTFAATKIDAMQPEATSIDALTSQLKSAAPDFAAISEIAGAEVAAAVRSMSAKSRTSLADGIADRRAELSRLEGESDANLEMSFRNEMTAIASSENPAQDHANLKQRILSSGLSNFQSIATRADELFVQKALFDQTKFDVSVDAYEKIYNAINGNSTFTSDNEQERGLYDLMNSAHKISPATISGRMSNSLSSRKATIQSEIKDTRIQALASAAVNGQRLSNEDLNQLGESIFGNDPVFVSTLDAHPKALEMFSAGVVLPQVGSAMSNALQSNNEVELRAAIELFEQGVNTQGKLMNGEVVRVDSMRAALSEGDYARYSAVLFANRQFNEDPMSLMAQMRSYDGNIDADIREDFELPKSASINRVLEGVPMSSGYRREIIDTLRVMKARGSRIDQESLDGIIESYTQNAKKDDAVIGPFIGDRTVYARLNYLDSETILGRENEITDALIQSNMFEDIMQGGTNLDAAVSRLTNPLNAMGINATGFFELLGDIDALSQLEKEQRIRNGLQAVGVEFKYRPIIQSFDVGSPAWEIGYDSGLGFTPFVINGEVQTLTGPVKSSERDGRRFSAAKDLTLAKSGSASPADLAKAEINYLATLDHVTANSFAEQDEFRILDERLNGGAMELFIEARKQYEGKQ